MMRFTLSYIMVLLTCLVGLPQANAQGIPSSGEGAVQKAVESVDPHALALLQQSDAIYKAMQSFLTEFEDGMLDKRGRASFSIHGQFAFRRPDHLAFAIGSTDARIAEPKRMIADGEHAYTLLSRSPFPYIPMPMYDPARTEWLVRRAWSGTAGHLYGLLVDKGMKPDHPGLELKSLTSKREKFVDGTPVETVKGRWVSTERDSKYWEIDTYTIGQRDHLLYQTSIQYHNSSGFVTRYFHPQTNLTLPDGLFTVPPDAVLLPSAYVTAVESDDVKLDKGSLDGLEVNDVLVVFRVSTFSRQFKTAVGRIAIVKIEAHTCEAKILEMSGGIIPTDVCEVVDHYGSLTRTKTKPNNNAWLWTPVRR
ncbi:MAG: hypothetical protein JWN14_3000 [Chthonomonadales bacterium]|nr:hypothetical protein [Chthonomonadales bacterium]